MSTQEEREMFRAGGANRQTLAVICMARRLGIHVALARQILKKECGDGAH